MLFSITFVESIVDDLDIPILDILDSLLIIFDVEIANSDADGLFVFSASFVEITIFDVESLIPGKELLIVDVIYSVFFGFVVGSFFSGKELFIFNILCSIFVLVEEYFFS